MSAAESKTVFDDLLELLADGTDAERLMNFRLPADTQTRLDDLLDKNREGMLEESEKAELDSFCQ